MVSIRIIIDRFRAMSRTPRLEGTLSFDGAAHESSTKVRTEIPSRRGLSHERQGGRMRSSSAWFDRNSSDAFCALMTRNNRLSPGAN